MTVLTRTISPRKMKVALRHAITKKRPVFLWGPPGIGKSDLVHQLGSDIGAHVIDVRLSLWEPTDIKGIPYFDSNVNKMVWAAPSELPDAEYAKKHKHIFLFLDEMNSAAPAVQAAAYQLILNRRVGTYQLPDNVSIIAAGNRDSDKGVTYRMPAPLANRFIHLEMTVDFEDWLYWATSNFVHPDVIGFLTFSKKDLFDFDPKSPSHSFPTPRSWSFVSELLDDNVHFDTLSDLVAGAVGEGLAVKFMTHRKLVAKLPNPVDILSGKVTEVKNIEISGMYSLTTSLCYELKLSSDKKEKNFYEKANNFLKFTMNNFETEIVVMGLRLALMQYSLPIDPSRVECFSEVHAKYSKYVKAAQGL